MCHAHTTICSGSRTYLVIAHIVVALVDAPPVLTLPEGLLQGDAVPAGVILHIAHHGHGPMREAGAVLQVDLPGGVRAVLLNRAVLAGVGCPRGRLTPSEVVEATEGLDFGALAIPEPVGHQVEIVAALGQQGEGAPGHVAPVATHEGVRKVPEEHIFRVRDGDHLADAPAQHDLTDLGARRVVPEQCTKRIENNIGTISSSYTHG